MKTQAHLHNNERKGKRGRASLFILISLFLLFPSTVSSTETAKLEVLTSFLPIYIFTKNVVGEREGVSVDLLIPGDVGPHDYHMRPSDMRRLSQADMIIINGLGIEDFLGDAMKNKSYESAGPLNLIPNRWDDHDHEHDHESNFNPHTWVSPKMAMLQVTNIAVFLSRLDPSGKDEYRKNAEAYVKRLQQIQTEMEEALKTLKERKIVTFHNAFDYLARDLGLEIVDVIYKSAVEELSAGEMVSIIDTIKENKIKVIFSEPQFSKKMADLLARESGAKVYSLDPVATGEKNADYYEKAMRKNISVLKAALQ